MRIVYVCADRGVPVLGGKGASVHVRSITDALTRRGHHVIVACTTLGSGNPPPVVDQLFAFGASDPEEVLERLLADCRPDAVIERYSLGCGPARRASARLGVPLVLEVNAPLVLEAARHRGLTDIESWLAYEREVFASADAVGVVSKGLASYVADVVPGVRPHWIPNGVDVEAFASAVPVDLGLPRGAVSVAFAGSMKAWHGVTNLVDVMQPLVSETPAHLILIGSGPEIASVARRVTEHGLGGRVHLLGQVAHDEMRSLLASADVGVAPYALMTDFYFSPLKVLEYLAAGLPVVCPALGDLPDLVGDAGLLYAAGDPDGLAKAMACLIDDRASRQTMALRARGRASLCTWDANAAAYERLIAEATTTRSRRAEAYPSEVGWP